MADYLTIAEADGYVTSTLNASSWTSATTAQKAAAIAQATREVDAMRFQGQKYDSTQEREFPRIVGVQSGVIRSGPGAPWVAATVADDIWDWDSNTNAAIVPTDVKRACFEQALSLIRDANRSGRLDAIADGVAAQAAGGVSESYRPDAKPGALCRNAQSLLNRYRLKTGSMV